jgi:hypothetical protein
MYYYIYIWTFQPFVSLIFPFPLILALQFDIVLCLYLQKIVTAIWAPFAPLFVLLVICLLCMFFLSLVPIPRVEFIVLRLSFLTVDVFSHSQITSRT